LIGFKDNSNSRKPKDKGFPKPTTYKLINLVHKYKKTEKNKVDRSKTIMK